MKHLTMMMVFVLALGASSALRLSDESNVPVDHVLVENQDENTSTDFGEVIEKWAEQHLDEIKDQVKSKEAFVSGVTQMLVDALHRHQNDMSAHIEAMFQRHGLGNLAGSFEDATEAVWKAAKQSQGKDMLEMYESDELFEAAEDSEKAEDSEHVAFWGRRRRRRRSPAPLAANKVQCRVEAYDNDDSFWSKPQNQWFSCYANKGGSCAKDASLNSDLKGDTKGFKVHGCSCKIEFHAPNAKNAAVNFVNLAKGKYYSILDREYNAFKRGASYSLNMSQKITGFKMICYDRDTYRGL